MSFTVLRKLSRLSESSKIPYRELTSSTCTVVCKNWGKKNWEKNWNKPGGLFTSFRWLWSGCLVRGLGGQGQGMSATAHRQKGFGRVDMASASLRIVAAILEGEPKRRELMQPRLGICHNSFCRLPEASGRIGMHPNLWILLSLAIHVDANTISINCFLDLHVDDCTCEERLPASWLDTNHSDNFFRENLWPFNEYSMLSVY